MLWLFAPAMGLTDDERTSSRLVTPPSPKTVPTGRAGLLNLAATGRQRSQTPDTSSSPLRAEDHAKEEVCLARLGKHS